MQARCSMLELELAVALAENSAKDAEIVQLRQQALPRPPTRPSLLSRRPIVHVHMFTLGGSSSSSRTSTWRCQSTSCRTSSQPLLFCRRHMRLSCRRTLASPSSSASGTTKRRCTHEAAPPRPHSRKIATRRHRPPLPSHLTERLQWDVSRNIPNYLTQASVAPLLTVPPLLTPPPPPPSRRVRPPDFFVPLF